MKTRNLIFLIVLSSIFGSVKAQVDVFTTSDSMSNDSGQVFEFVEMMPEFPGGQSAMYKFIQQNLKYPPKAQKEEIQGRIILQFIVSESGKIGNIEIIRGIGGGCEEEAIRVMKLMPNWSPGKHKGKKVPVKFTLPIVFKLEGPKFRLFKW